MISLVLLKNSWWPVENWIAMSDLIRFYHKLIIFSNTHNVLYLTDNAFKHALIMIQNALISERLQQTRLGMFMYNSGYRRIPNRLIHLYALYTQIFFIVPTATIAPSTFQHTSQNYPRNISMVFIWIKFIDILMICVDQTTHRIQHTCNQGLIDIQFDVSFCCTRWLSMILRFGNVFAFWR